MTDEELAEVALRAGRADWAGEIRRRHGRKLTVAEGQQAHAEAIQFIQQNDWAKAESKLLDAIRAEPMLSERHDHLGVVYANLGRLADAEICFRLATEVDPTALSPHRNVVQSLFDQKKFSEAAAFLVEARKRFPADDEMPLQLAAAYAELKQFAEAEAVLLSLPESAKQSPHYWNRLGVIRGFDNRAEEAIICFQEQIKREPTGAAGYANLAAAYGKAHRWTEAVEAGKIATQRDPKNAAGWANLGNALRDLGRLPEAEIALKEALRWDANSRESYGNLALTMAMNGRVREALPLYERAIQMKPDAAEIRFNRAVALLSLGDYEQGWREYEWRWGTEQMKGQMQARQYRQPVWRGEPLRGKTLLVHCEQGHGDTFQFLKLVQLVHAQGAKVLVIVADITATLVKTAPGVSGVYVHGDTLPAFDYHTPLMTLPLLLQLRVETIPRETPYLAAPMERVEFWKKRLEALPGRKIGIAWQGNPNHIGDRWRSVKLSQFAPVLETKGITFVAMQKGAGKEQLSDWKGTPLIDLGAELGNDFADTAGLLCALDGLITIDSALAHLAGALARPVTILLPKNADWRWMQDRTDTPWYPTATLSRQQTFGDWAPVFEQVAKKLDENEA